MDSSLDHNTLLTRSYMLTRGPRVRLRLAQTRDAAAIAALLQRPGSDPAALDIARLVRFDPRRRVVICATALLGSAERVAAEAGVPLDAYLDLVRATVENVADLGPVAALTGPAARGDLATIERHRAVLPAGERPAYEALLERAQRLAAVRDAEAVPCS